MSPEQCRAARGLLDLTQDELAGLADLSSTTVRCFETRLRHPKRSNVVILRRALEAAGVEFLDKGGQGVRFSRGRE